MKIIVKSIKDIMIKDKYPAVEIKGTRLDNNEEWSTKFFKNNEELLDQSKTVDTGDAVEINMMKNNGYWNPKKISKIAMPSGGLSGGGSNKGGWNGRTGSEWNRSAAVYLAKDIIEMATTDAQARKAGVDGIVKRLFQIADDIYNYISDESDEDPAALLGNKVEDDEPEDKPSKSDDDDDDEDAETPDPPF